MSDSKRRLREIWFQVHKWIGITLAILIIPISLTGSALVWHDALDAALNPERSSDVRPGLPPSAYAQAALREAAPGEKLVSLAYPEEPSAVVATLARPTPPGGGGRPVRTILYLDPQDGRLLDRSASNEGAVHVMHVLHGSLMMPGVGRQIVGWIGVAMLLSSLTGLWLWWPLKGGFARGLRWQRQPATSANLHHQGGFWICLPLAVLSLTGAWISFPAFFASLSGDPAPPSAAERARRMGAAPIAETRLTPDAVLASSSKFQTGPLTTINWPAGEKAEWKITYQRDGGPAEVTIADATGEAKGPKPPQPETTGRLMRRIHDGTGMGPLWQAIIFIGGIIPALLAITGLLMWWNVRQRKRRMSERRQARGVPMLDAAE
jgi:uncharacterized iron-regulated membrane protein